MKETKQKNIGNQNAKLPLDQARSKNWTIRCNSVEFARWAEAAEQSGTDRSFWTRTKLNED